MRVADPFLLMQCLICLDEYDTEDDIRVMTCRHAFHKSCVDKWLQTGRNNCPACRTPVCLYLVFFFFLMRSDHCCRVFRRMGHRPYTRP